MDPELFLADLEQKPESLERLARSLESGDSFVAVPEHVRRVVFLGMGSSRYAAEVAALRLRAAGVDAVAEYASAELSYPPAPDALVVAISASGQSAETLHAIKRYQGRSPLVALTNRPDSAITVSADLVVPMHAGAEDGGVACRSFQHTGLLLRALHNHLTGVEEDLPGLLSPGCLSNRRPAGPPRRLAPSSPAAARWPPRHLLHRPSRALVLRRTVRADGARGSAAPIRPACETGDWAHVDLYVAKTLDYRAVFFPGSRYDAQAMEWVGKRRSTVVSVGAEAPGAAHTVRYRGDDDPDIALHTETLVAELVAATWWRAQTSSIT